MRILFLGLFTELCLARSFQNDFVKNLNETTAIIDGLVGGFMSVLNLDFDPKKSDTRGYEPNGHRCDTVGPVPSDIRRKYNLDYFYQRYTHAYGIPILSSGKVRDETLKRACYIVRFMMADREDLRKAMFEKYGRVGIMAEYPKEVTTDIPEHAYLKDDLYTNWDERARGLGGTLSIPVTTVGEENLLCLNGDRYWNQDILVHEFAHGIHLISLMTADKTFNNRLVSAYRTAMSQGKWQNTYAATDEKEYWAIGVQAYFNVGAKGPEHGDGIHNHIDNRNDLYYYDLNLYALVNEAFPCLNNIIDRCGSQNDVLGDLKMNCGGGNPDNNCFDENEYCEDWANIGECEMNPGYMLQFCKKSCGVC